MAGKLFGTDGIRGKANHYPLTPEMAARIGRAVGRFFNRSGKQVPITLGRDTRISGPMLEAAVAAGICAAGTDVLLAGMIPTPAVAFLTRTTGSAAGIMISASHNPYDDNGIKLFGPEGYKLSERQEREIEALILKEDDSDKAGGHNRLGTIRTLGRAAQDYRTFLHRQAPAHFSLDGRCIVLDCANGATSAIAAELFVSWGAQVTVLCDAPNGVNINDGCGSEHTERLRRRVVEARADVGLAFDGDGDRMIAVDETGALLTGDQLLAIGARFLKDQDALVNNRVVSTVMSNMGLKEALASMRIEHRTCQVGDRFVMEAMKDSGAVLGGEDSGHMIYLQHHTTGDGLLSALKLLQVMQARREPLSALARVMKPYPQVLINVNVRAKPDLDDLALVQQAIEAAVAQLDGRGRVLVRYSGTQDMCRVMVEGPNEADVRKHCLAIGKAVSEAIGQ